MRSCCLIFFIACWTSVPAYSENLIPNGDFEMENICTEYTQNCAPEAWVATSLWANYYFDDLGKGYDGTHFVGLTAGNILTPGIRNFIRTRLLCGMRKGNRYKLEMYVRAHSPVIDSIGVYFSNTDFLFDTRSFKQIQPALWADSGFSNPRGPHHLWQRLQWTYTATGDENYIVIGSFKRVDYKGIIKAEMRKDYYFFLDAVSLTPLDPQEKLCSGADSVRDDIYGYNERHKMLERKVYLYKRTPPKYPNLPKTRIVPLQKIDTLIIPDIFFKTASYQLSPASHHLLDSFANALSKRAIDSIVIEGHTDTVGKLTYNEALSLNRATAVQEYITSRLPFKPPFSARGYAFLRPIATNKTPQGRQLNRRVEIFVYRKQ